MLSPNSSRLGKPSAEQFYSKEHLAEIREDYNSKCADELEDIYLSNFLWNVRVLPTYPGILGFKQILKGVPAVVVGLGPSLNQHLPLLREYRKRVVVVAGDAALPLLLKSNITPDFVVVADPTEKQARNFDDVDTTKFFTVIPSAVHPSVVRKLDPRHTAVYNIASPNSKVLHQAPYHIGRKGALPASILTSGCAFTFTTVLGCDPILFIGHDLSWPSPDKVYAEGTFGWKVDFQKAAKFKSGCMLFPDIHGKLVLTHHTFVCFWAWMRDACKKYNFRVVNCSEAGILKSDEIAAVPFSVALKRWCKGELIGVSEKVLKGYEYLYEDKQVEELLLPGKERLRKPKVKEVRLANASTNSNMDANSKDGCIRSPYVDSVVGLRDGHGGPVEHNPVHPAQSRV